MGGRTEREDSGLAGVARILANPLRNWAESSTYVASGYRSCEIGRKLLTFATEHARSVKLSCVLGFIKARKATPIRIVESLGWRAVGASPPIELGDAEWCWHFLAGHITYTCDGVGPPLSDNAVSASPVVQLLDRVDDRQDC